MRETRDKSEYQEKIAAKQDAQEEKDSVAVALSNRECSEDKMIE
jgi:hypothetical protein